MRRRTRPAAANSPLLSCPAQHPQQPPASSTSSSASSGSASLRRCLQATASSSVSALQRKNAAYLLAVQAGADILFDGGDEKLELLLCGNISSNCGGSGDSWLDTIAHTYRTAPIAERQQLSESAPSSCLSSRGCLTLSHSQSRQTTYVALSAH